MAFFVYLSSLKILDQLGEQFLVSWFSLFYGDFSEEGREKKKKNSQILRIERNNNKN